MGSCVDLLKCQAARASCPLDLLAAESLGTRLVTLCSSTSDQLLTKSQQVNEMFCLVYLLVIDKDIPITGFEVPTT